MRVVYCVVSSSTSNGFGMAIGVPAKDQQSRLLLGLDREPRDRLLPPQGNGFGSGYPGENRGRLVLPPRSGYERTIRRLTHERDSYKRTANRCGLGKGAGS